MDVDEAPTDLVLPDVMEGMLRMAALTTPDTLTDAAKTWTEAQATTALKVALDLIGDHRRDAGFSLLALCRQRLATSDTIGRVCLTCVGERSHAVAGVALLQKLLPADWPSSQIDATTISTAAVEVLADPRESDLVRKQVLALLKDTNHRTRRRSSRAASNDCARRNRPRACWSTRSSRSRRTPRPRLPRTSWRGSTTCPFTTTRKGGLVPRSQRRDRVISLLRKN